MNGIRLGDCNYIAEYGITAETHILHDCIWQDIFPKLDANTGKYSVVGPAEETGNDATNGLLLLNP